MVAEPIGAIFCSRAIDGQHEIPVFQHLAQDISSCSTLLSELYLANGCWTDPRHFQGIHRFQFLSFFELFVFGAARQLSKEIRRGNIRWIVVQLNDFRRFSLVLYIQRTVLSCL